MKLARLSLFVSLLCLASLGWVRAGDPPPVQPGTQPIVITSVSEGVGAPFRFAQKTYQHFKVKVVSYKDNWDANSYVSLSVTPVGDMAQRVVVSTVDRIVMGRRKNHLYGDAEVFVRSKAGGPALTDEDVQLEIEVQRHDSTGAVTLDKAHALVTLDFPGTALRKGPLPVTQTETSPPMLQPGTQPIVVANPDNPIPPPPNAYLPTVRWQLAVDVPKASLKNSNLVFTVDPMPSFNQSLADRLKITPGFVYKLATTSIPGNTQFVHCEVIVTITSYPGGEVDSTVPLMANFSLYNSTTGELRTRLSIPGSVKLKFLP